MASRPPRQHPQPNLSSEELAWVGSVAERYDALVFHWVGPADRLVLLPDAAPPVAGRHEPTSGRAGAPDVRRPPDRGFPMSASSPIDPQVLRARLIELEPAAAADPAAIRVIRAPGSGQPHRRAHRLQRRVRAAGRDRPRDAHRVHPHRRRPGGAAQRGERRAAGVRPGGHRARGPAPGATTSRAPRSRWRQAGPADARAAGRARPPRVPVGAGLSSSAALELATCWALSGRAGARGGRHDPRAALPAGRERVRGRAVRADGPVRLRERRGRRRGAARLPLAGLARGAAAARTSCWSSPTRACPGR